MDELEAIEKGVRYGRDKMRWKAERDIGVIKDDGRRREIWVGLETILVRWRG